MSLVVLERDQATVKGEKMGFEREKNVVDVIFTMERKPVWQDRRLRDYFKS